MLISLVFLHKIQLILNGAFYVCLLPSLGRLQTQKQYDNDLNSEIRGVPWKDKIETAIWRGRSTGCALDFRNPRLLISKINQEWKNDPKLKGYLDAGVVGQIKKAKKHITSKEVKRVNLKELGIQILGKMSMKEQMKYKYILDSNNSPKIIIFLIYSIDFR